MNIECGITDNGDSEEWGDGKGVDDDKLLNGYNVCFSGNEHLKSPNFTTLLYSHVIKLHSYSVIYTKKLCCYFAIITTCYLNLSGPITYIISLLPPQQKILEFSYLVSWVPQLPFLSASSQTFSTTTVLWCCFWGSLMISSLLIQRSILFLKKKKI